MVFSKESYIKKYNLDQYNAVEPDIINILKSNDSVSSFVNSFKDEYKDLDFEDIFYTEESIKAKYGIDKRFIDLLLIVNQQFAFSEKEENREKIDKLWDKQLEIFGSKLFNDIDSHATSDDIVSSPKVSVTNSQLLLMVDNGDKHTAAKLATDLEFDMFFPEADFFRKEKKFVLFDKFKKDVLDRIPRMEDKLDSVLGYLYVQQAICEGFMEKKALDYYMEKSNYLSVLQYMPGEKEIENTDREVDKWLKKHNKPETFFDFSKNSTLDGPRRLITQLLKILGLPYYHMRLHNSSDRMKKERLKKIFAVLNKSPEVYKNDKDFRDLLIYFCYAIWPIIEHGRLFAITCTSHIFKYEKSLYEKQVLISRKDKEIEPLKKQLAIKQEQLNKLQLEYDRLKNKELAKLQTELEEKNRLLKELCEKNSYLEEMNNVLEKQLEEMESAAEDYSSDASVNYPSQYIENHLKNLNIVIMGGHQLWQNKLKEIYPYFNYIDTDNVNFDINITRNADYVFFNTLHCSHTLFYKIKNNVNNGRTNNKEKLVFISSNNLSYFKEVVSKSVLPQDK